MTPGAVPPADNNDFVSACPACGKRIIVDRSDEGKNLTCPYCNQTITVSRSRYSGDYMNDHGGQPQQQPGANPAMGWIIFILIFGVGNVILYSTTGIVLIPIRR